MRGHLPVPSHCGVGEADPAEGRASAAALPPAEGPIVDSVRVVVAVRVRLFARLRELAGFESESVEVPPESTVADVFAAVRRSHPSFQVEQDGVRAALNQEFADWDEVVSDGDEVAFIPPVSGGVHVVGVLFEVITDPLDARRVE
jgi:molybdopterin converting factor subunit 1